MNLIELTILIILITIIVTIIYLIVYYKRITNNEIYEINIMNNDNKKIIYNSSNCIYDDISEKIENNNESTILSSISNYFKISETSKSVIPMNIFQTWHSKYLPPKMKKNCLSLKKSNPEFKYYLFDDEDCREFIKSHYNSLVLGAFDKLKPGAYKADLWRCCILYVYGGIYLDIKFNCVNGFKLIELTDDEYFVKDWGNDLAVYNAFIICKPKNHILLSCIKEIVKNVENKYYGDSALDVTGPKMMIKFFTPKEKRNLKRLKLELQNNKLCICRNDETILENYNEYKIERQLNQLNEHYSILWNKKDIYN